MTSQFYIEHTKGFDTTVWAQWLTPAGLGVPTIDQYQGWLSSVEPSGIAGYILAAEIDTASSSFKFEIPNDWDAPVGQHAATIDVKDTGPGGTSGISHLIARGLIVVLDPAPAIEETP